MTRGRSRHVLAAVLLALAVLAGCGGSDDEPSDAGSASSDEGGATDGGSDEGGDEGTAEVTLTAERVADLDPISIGSTAAGDDALFAVTVSGASSGLVRIGTDGTVTDLSAASDGVTISSLFTTSAGVFAAVHDAADVCGYASVDQTTGAVGATIPLPTEEQFCFPPGATWIEDGTVATIVGDQMVLVDTAVGTVEEVTADLPASTDTLQYSHGVAVADDALYVTSVGYDPNDPESTDSTTIATRLERDGLEQTAQGELPGGLVVLPTGLVSREWTDANGDGESQPEEVATFTVDPETLEVTPTDEELDRGCPLGELARLPQEAGVWHTTREEAGAPFEVLLVTPGTCDALGSVELAPLEGETAETLIRAVEHPLEGDLFVLRQVFDSAGTEAPTPATLDRVSVE